MNNRTNKWISSWISKLVLPLISVTAPSFKIDTFFYFLNNSVQNKYPILLILGTQVTYAVVNLSTTAVKRYRTTVPCEMQTSWFNWNHRPTANGCGHWIFCGDTLFWSFCYHKSHHPPHRAGIQPVSQKASNTWIILLHTCMYTYAMYLSYTYLKLFL